MNRITFSSLCLRASVVVLMLITGNAFAVTQQHTYPTGWNMVSVPLVPTDSTPSAVYNEVTPLHLYDYNSGDTLSIGEAGFQPITAGRALWLLLPASTQIQVDGALADTQTPYHVALAPGWNAIATPWPTAVKWNDAGVSVMRGFSTLPLSSAIASGWIEGQLRSYQNPNGPYTTINPNTVPAGTLAAWSGYLVYANFTCELIFAPPPHNTIPPHVAFNSPGEKSEVRVLTDIFGTAEDDDLIEWTLEFAPIETGQFTTLATSNVAITNGFMSKLDPTLQLNGIGTLRLSATDLSGNSAETERTVFIEGDNKLGNFRISFVDLEVPLSGIPISIRRTYDSRLRSASRDFGYGWTIEVIAAGKYRNNRAQGDGWNLASGPLGIPCASATETKSHVTEIRFSDREFYRFAFVATPGAPITGGCEVNGSFVQIGGIPGASLSDLTGGMANRLFWQNSTDQIIDTDTTETFEPDRVRLTTLDGRKFDLNLLSGLYRIADLHNNVVTISATGVSHSSGKSISILRDGSGRVQSITDPQNKSITYSYQGGDLTLVTNRTNDTVGFGYDGSHFLTSIIDGENHTALTAIYDSEGRVIELRDADGNPSQLSHDIVANSSSATDRLGATTSFVYGNDGYLADVVAPGSITTHYTYNARGKVLTETDPLNHTTTYTYDSKDNMLTREDPLHHVTSYTYNSRGQVLTTTDPKNLVATNTYDSVTGNLLSVEDALHHVTTYTYNSRGDLLTEEDPLHCMTTNEYDAFGNLTRKTDAENNVTDFTYDGNGNQLTQTVYRTEDGVLEDETTQNVYDFSGRLKKTIDPLLNETVTTYDANGRQKTQQDALHRITRFEYDSRGNLFKTIYPDTTFEVYAYDLEGRRTATTDRNNHTIFVEYDSLGRVKKNIRTDATYTENFYDDAGRLNSVKNERGFSTTYEYDEAGRRKKIIDALSHETKFGYDENGNQLTVEDANGHITTNEYDDNNRMVKVTFHDGSFKTTGYDEAGRRISETDQAGKTTQFEYDCVGRLKKVIDPLLHETVYTYDEVGNQLTQTDANTHTTEFEYDELGRRVKRELPLGMFETMHYNAVGNMDSRTDFNGATTTFEYDINNRLQKKTYPDTSAVSFTYTASGQRKTVTDFRGVTTYNYDDRDRLTYVEHPNGSVISYDYDESSNRKSVTIPSGTTSYTFDELNRLKTVKDTDNGITSYDYDEAGNRKSVTYPNGTKVEYTYDDLNRLELLTNSKSDLSTISSYDYVLGASGNRTAVTEHTGRNVGYQYDDLYRLTRETILGDRTIDYSYDNVGNRQTKTDSTSGITVYAYDDNDRLLTEGATSYSYDDNGNTKTKSETAGVTTYDYDYENHLTRATSPSGIAEYQYDADGNRVQSYTNGVVTRYLVDTNRDYAQVLEERDASGALVVSYTYGDDLIRQKRGSAISYYHYDGQMSTRQLTDATQSITDDYTFDAFGVLLSSSGSAPNNYLYTGEQFDANIGFYYLRARYYNQAAGRFLSLDRFEGDHSDPLSLHKYFYAHLNPSNLQDPSGFFASSFETSAALGVVESLVMVAALSYPVVKANIDIAKAGKLKSECIAKQSSRCKAGDYLLFHYTGKDRATSIAKSGRINASPPFTAGNFTFPSGAYATDVPPWDITMTQLELRILFYGGWRIDHDVSWFVAICASDFSELKGVPPPWGRQYFRPAPEGGEVPVTVVTHGKNLMPDAKW